ncbi:peptidyl-prolyl cis-trans isomerase B (cyclophilin B) [Hoeflea marina]|uniref:Peptidyl-prolyl cis-trans isomerase n=1 Tax=Hoeflea marina TaxID=274592 RepID=A0A317PR32_9HYPH|nr:peptidylprolyl isomerase [Hoeflea marina]PWW03938.1 peptidyl-prolyl cis-trans isomerase B (cyclophilin B) [Hoeflea marina]
MRLRTLIVSALFAAGLMTASAASAADTVTIELKSGPVVIELATDSAPKHAARLKELADAGAYDGVVFHRVIDGFMAQTGDVQFGNSKSGYDQRRAGTGGSDKPDLPAEFTDEPFVRGTVGMARSSDPNSANSQFFIMFTEYPSLNGQYTIVGHVVSGMENVDAIKRGEGGNGEVSEPDEMISVKSGS